MLCPAGRGINLNIKKFDLTAILGNTAVLKAYIATTKGEKHQQATHYSHW